MKEYSTNPNDLSRAPTLDAFLVRYGQFLRNCATALKPGGRLAVLMGDYKMLTKVGVDAAVGRFENCVNEDVAEDFIRALMEPK